MILLEIKKTGEKVKPKCFITKNGARKISCIKDNKVIFYLPSEVRGIMR
jgi:hypothetical protein